MKEKKVYKYERYVGLAVIILLLAGFAYGGFEYSNLKKGLVMTESELADTTARFNALQEERDYIYENLLSEQAKNSLFENQIKEIAGTVGTLDKLSKTDKELLQKYSRVYFLNEHYVPESLATVTPQYVFEEGRAAEVHSKVLPFLEEMLKEAEAQGLPIRIVSAYRSFAEQVSLKGKYLVTYGSGANRFSADQGYSEHQLGTTVDLTTVKLGANFTQFGETEAFKWLRENAYKYGFILSYPENNSYYQYEPWHWRYVGKKLALRLHNEGESFYDVDQRVIDNYLISIFD